MVKFENVFYSVADGRRKKDILKNLNFILPDNGLIALIGKSGSGKTTILNLIAKTINKTSGKIYVNDIDYDSNKDSLIDDLRTNYVSIVFQDLELLLDLTLKDNIIFACKVKGIDFNLDLFNEYIDLLKLNDLEEEKVLYLSRGERQRVAILRAIITKPSIILLDEPTSSLDKENSIIVMDFLKKISSNVLVLFSSHDIDIVNLYTKDYVKLSYGEIEELKIEKNNQVEIKNISLEKKDNNFLYLEKKIFHKQGFKSIFATIILSISLIILMIPMSVLTYNKYEYTYNAYKKTEFETYILTSSSVLSNNALDINYYSDNYNNLEFNYFYFEALNNVKIGKNLVIDESYNDLEIGITDYTYKKLENSNLINNNIFTYGKYNFKIADVKTTNYDWYESLESIQKDRYINFLDYEYNNVYMNKYTALCLNEAYRGYKNINIKNNEYHVYDFDNYSNSLKLLNNTSTLGENEIIIGVEYIINNYNDFDSSNYEKYIGQSLDLNGITFILKDIIIAGVGDIILTSSSAYNQINTENIDLGSINLYTKLVEKSDSIRLMKDLDELEYNLITPYMNDISISNGEIEFLKSCALVIFIVAFILFVSSAIHLIASIIYDNKSRFGIARALGMSKRKLILLFGLYVSKIVFISMFVGILGFIIEYIVLNSDILDLTAFQTYIFDFDVLGFLLYIVSTLIVLIIIFAIIITNFNKKDIKEILNNR